MNTSKPMTKFRTLIYDKSLQFKPKPLLRPFVNTGPGIPSTSHDTFTQSPQGKYRHTKMGENMLSQSELKIVTTPHVKNNQVPF